MQKTVLLTGGAGFIGSHVAEAYKQKGYRVLIVDNLYTGSKENIADCVDGEAVLFFEVDVRDKDKLAAIFAEYRPSIINHHCAQKSVPASVEDPLNDLDINLKGLLTLIELTKEYPIENFIYVSSGGVLSKEITGNEKSKETDVPQLQSPYAITKFAGEKYLEIYSAQYGFGYTALRYGNVYGPRQMPFGECGVVPIFVENILNNRDSVLMAYDDMPDGCTRDYIYVKDVVDINMIVTERITNEAYNISYGTELSMMQIFNETKKAFHSDTNIKRQGFRKGDVRRSVLDNSYVYEKLGWKPKYSLEKGLQDLYQYVTKKMSE